MTRKLDDFSARGHAVIAVGASGICNEFGENRSFDNSDAIRAWIGDPEEVAAQPFKCWNGVHEYGRRPASITEHLHFSPAQSVGRIAGVNADNLRLYNGLVSCRLTDKSPSNSPASMSPDAATGRSISHRAPVFSGNVA